MRDIKFRAWNINQKQMFWWDLLWGNHRQGDGYIGMVPWGEKQTRHIHRDNMTLIDPDDCVLMQFTGLRDKNGKEIFEGDVVRWDDASQGQYWRVADVIYEPGHFTFRTIPRLCINCLTEEPYDFKLGGFAYCPDINLSGNVLEVIGNIYENVELVGGTQKAPDLEGLKHCK